MIRTLIIDDEENNRLRLKKMIAEHLPQIQVIGEADGVLYTLDCPVAADCDPEVSGDAAGKQ